MPLDPDLLVGYLRAEFAKAARLRAWLFFIQLAVAVPGAVSVFISDAGKGWLYFLAILGVALLSLWWLVSRYYMAARSAAQAARHAALLTGGLGERLSPSELERLRSRFTVTPREATGALKTDYYVTSQPTGPARLGEMLEESAFYSERLHAVSGRAMLGLIVGLALLAASILLSAAVFVTRDTGLTIVRVGLAGLVFVLSADVIGAWLAHCAAAKEIAQVRARLKVADRAGYPLGDVLLAMTDYSAAIESAPEVVPFAYDTCRPRLDRDWAAYIADRAAARTAPTLYRIGDQP